MQRLKIKVNVRKERGKEIAKKLRRQSFVPAVIYSEDTNVSLSIPSDSLRFLRSIHFSESTVIDLEIDDDKKSKLIPALIKDVQFHPLNEKVIHIDFLKISLKEKIKVNLAVVLKGDSKKVKEAEGTIEQVLRELEVEVFPLDIPEKLEVDISELEIGRSLHVADLNVPDKIKITTDPQATVVTAVAKKEEIVEEIAPEEAGPAEPEVIKEKKEVPEQEAPEGRERKGKSKEK